MLEKEHPMHVLGRAAGQQLVTEREREDIRPYTYYVLLVP